MSFNRPTTLQPVGPWTLKQRQRRKGAQDIIKRRFELNRLVSKSGLVFEDGYAHKESFFLARLKKLAIQQQELIFELESIQEFQSKKLNDENGELSVKPGTQHFDKYGRPENCSVLDQLALKRRAEISVKLEELNTQYNKILAACHVKSDTTGLFVAIDLSMEAWYKDVAECLKNSKPSKISRNSKPIIGKGDRVSSTGGSIPHHSKTEELHKVLERVVSDSIEKRLSDNNVTSKPCSYDFSNITPIAKNTKQLNTKNYFMYNPGISMPTYTLGSVIKPPSLVPNVPNYQPKLQESPVCSKNSEKVFYTPQAKNLQYVRPSGTLNYMPGNYNLKPGVPNMTQQTEAVPNQPIPTNTVLNRLQYETPEASWSTMRDPTNAAYNLNPFFVSSGYEMIHPLLYKNYPINTAVKNENSSKEDKNNDALSTRTVTAEINKPPQTTVFHKPSVIKNLFVDSFVAKFVQILNCEKSLLSKTKRLAS